MAKYAFLVVILLMFKHLKHCHGATTKVADPDPLGYLKKYGYIEAARAETTDGRSGNIKAIALKKFQKFAHLAVTGRMDAPTIEMLTSPRCGGKDNYNDMKRRKRYARQGTRWYKKTLTYSVHGQKSPSSRISAKQVKKTLARAFQQWQAVTTLTFKKLKNNDHAADIKISFHKGDHRDLHPFDGKGGTLAHGFYPVSLRGFEGDVHYDDDEDWSLRGEKETTDFMWTSLHEIGHAIGLEHSRKREAIMWPWFPGFKTSFKLDSDDINGIRSIYGSAKPSTITSVTKVAKSTICKKDTFDAVLYDAKSQQTYFFKRSKVWRMDQNKYVTDERPKRTHDIWRGLPRYIEIDSAYVNKAGSTIFFKGNRYWEIVGQRVIRSNRPVKEYIRNVGDAKFKFPSTIDAAMVYDGNGKTYFFNSGLYWRYNEDDRQLDRGYPRRISDHWHGVRFPISAAIGWRKSKTLFFSRDRVYRYSSAHNRLTDKNGRQISDFFRNCK